MEKNPLNKNILDDFFNKKATNKQSKELNDWYNSFDDSKVIIEENLSEEELKNKILSRLQKNIRVTPKSNVVFLKWVGKASATILITLSAYLSYQYFKTGSREQRSFLNSTKIAETGPTKGALIKLGDDSTLILTTFKTKYDNDFFVFDKQQKNAKNELVELIVPKGRQFKISLSDGTKVWLNADSKLSFPRYFDGITREVELVGQAYFEVEKNPKQPFIVKTATQNIKVLGTHFDVNSYQENKFEETTLLEGKVEISLLNNAIKKVLQVGEVAKIDVEKAVITDGVYVEQNAWIDNVFVFENQTLKEILANVSRWYNVPVVVKNILPNKTFNGKIEKQSTLREVLAMLELVSGQKIVLDDNKIIVKN